MNQFVQRVANYVANEIIIKGLAHNKTFQKFALRTDQQFKEVNKMTSEKITKTVEELAKTTGVEGAAGATTAVGGPPKPPLRGFPGFVSCFFKEIRKDLGLGS
mmetsp:Transcript_4167/g.8406  ORF Transcript_4167/g.8406 Transcript_4167/m.8406 type:complete len:103 (-) Transcript_4167:84-392(-)|eukprot:scaffold5886_cov161-Amphora_coffeaeformis.AAC.1